MQNDKPQQVVVAQGDEPQQIGVRQGDEPHQAIVAQGEGWHTSISGNNITQKHKVKNKQQQKQGNEQM